MQRVQLHLSIWKKVKLLKFTPIDFKELYFSEIVLGMQWFHRKEIRTHLLEFLKTPLHPHYFFSLSNKRAAQLIDSLKKSNLYTLIPSSRFINFGKFWCKNVFHSSNFWNSKPAKPYSIQQIYQFWEIFHPARLLDRLEYLSFTFLVSYSFNLRIHHTCYRKYFLLHPIFSTHINKIDLFPIIWPCPNKIWRKSLFICLFKLEKYAFL